MAFQPKKQTTWLNNGGLRSTHHSGGALIAVRGPTSGISYVIASAEQRDYNIIVNAMGGGSENKDQHTWDTIVREVKEESDNTVDISRCDPDATKAILWSNGKSVTAFPVLDSIPECFDGGKKPVIRTKNPENIAILLIPWKEVTGAIFGDRKKNTPASESVIVGGQAWSLPKRYQGAFHKLAKVVHSGHFNRKAKPIDQVRLRVASSLFPMSWDQFIAPNRYGVLMHGDQVALIINSNTNQWTLPTLKELKEFGMLDKFDPDRSQRVDLKNEVYCYEIRPTFDEWNRIGTNGLIKFTRAEIRFQISASRHTVEYLTIHTDLE